jgi:hypothetical protein
VFARTYSSTFRDRWASLEAKRNSLREGVQLNELVGLRDPDRTLYDSLHRGARNSALRARLSVRGARSLE